MEEQITKVKTPSARTAEPDGPEYRETDRDSLLDLFDRLTTHDQMEVLLLARVKLQLSAWRSGNGSIPTRNLD